MLQKTTNKITFMNLKKQLFITLVYNKRKTATFELIGKNFVFVQYVLNEFFLATRRLHTTSLHKFWKLVQYMKKTAGFVK